MHVSAILVEDEEYVWDSQANGSFSVKRASEGDKPPFGGVDGRGTCIVLHLKKDQDKFLDSHRLSRIIQRHSNYVPYEVQVWTEEEIEKVQEKTEEGKQWIG